MSDLPTSLIKAIDDKYMSIDAKLTEARTMLAEGRYVQTKAARRKLIQNIAYLEARQAGQLDIMIETHNYETTPMSREELYHGTGFAPDARFIQIN